ncbi:MAG: DUF433 domain-containing protein, partial [Sciscionella sp.]
MRYKVCSSSRQGVSVRTGISVSLATSAVFSSPLFPAIRNVQTDSLAEDFRAGTSREELADLYDLSPEQVDEAIRFELIAGSERAA